MFVYGKSLLAIAIVLGVLAFTSYAGTFAYAIKVAAAVFFIVSLLAFAREQRESHAA